MRLLPFYSSSDRNAWFRIRNSIPFRLFRLGLAVLVLGLSLSCASESDTVPIEDAYVQLFVAIDVRRSECGEQPDYFLPVIDEPTPYGLNACVFAIVRGECPFLDYPLICLEMYNTDVPGSGP